MKVLCPCLSVFLCSVALGLPSEVQDGIVALIVPCFFVHTVLCRVCDLYTCRGPNSSLFAVNSLRTVESASDLSRLRTERSWYRDGSGEPWLPVASVDCGSRIASRWKIFLRAVCHLHAVPS